MLDPRVNQFVVTSPLMRMRSGIGYPVLCVRQQVIDQRGSRVITVRFVLASAAICIALGRFAAAAQAPGAIAPPHVLSLPPISVARDIALPESGRVEVEVLVAPDGTGTVEQCVGDVGEALCERVRSAMRGARFEPALRDGAAVAARVKVVLALVPEAPATGTAATADGGEAVPGADDVASPASPPADTSVPETSEEFGATARVVPAQPGMHRLELAETRDMPRRVRRSVSRGRRAAGNRAGVLRLAVLLRARRAAGRHALCLRRYSGADALPSGDRPGGDPPAHGRAGATVFGRGAGALRALDRWCRGR